MLRQNRGINKWRTPASLVYVKPSNQVKTAYILKGHVSPPFGIWRSTNDPGIHYAVISRIENNFTVTDRFGTTSIWCMGDSTTGDWLTRLIEESIRDDEDVEITDEYDYVIESLS